MDTLFIFIGLFISMEFNFSLRIPDGHMPHLWTTSLLLIPSTLAGLTLSRIYRSLVRYAGVDMLIQAITGTLAGTGFTYLVSLVFYLFRDNLGTNVFLMPRPV